MPRMFASRFLLTSALVIAALVAQPASAQPTQKTPPAASFDTATWRKPTPPLHIAGPIYYIGTADLGVYLITTPAGHIMLDGALAESATQIEQSIRTLGFKVEDIRILLISQAHFDHVASLAHFKKKTGAQVLVMKGDEGLVASGGKTDYLFAKVPEAHYAPVKADRVLNDGDTVTLGDVTLTARLTPGHTPGTTTWTTTVTDKGRPFRVVFAGSTTVNPGTRLVNNPSYPGIADDFRRAFAVQESLTPDIFLAAHASFFDLAGKRVKAEKDGALAFVDGASYRKLVAAKKADFEALVAKERSAPATAGR
jgi:metallo-beta-lactamase class B